MSPPHPQDGIEDLIQEALDKQRKGFLKIINESFWQCPIHEELQMDGSCKECDQCLEVNVILDNLLNSINKLK